MRYRQLTIVVVVLVFAFIIIDSNDFLRNNIIKVADSIRLEILDSRDSLVEKYEKHLDQAKSIEKYKKIAQEYDKLALELLNVKKELDAISLFDTQQTYYNDNRFFPARAYSYVGMGDYKRVWINFDVSGYENGRFFGIVQDGKALGIAIVENDRLIGLLNGEKQSSYSVFIGDNKIPAIIHHDSLSLENLVADYIPLWKEINVGDQVFTSGLDGIFIEGILVGEVISIKRDLGYITAEIKPYAKTFNLDYIWLVDTKIPFQSAPQESAF